MLFSYFKFFSIFSELVNNYNITFIYFVSGKCKNQLCLIKRNYIKKCEFWKINSKTRIFIPPKG